MPWVGFPLADLLKRFEPTASAKYVEFTTIVRPDEMNGQRSRLFSVLSWPYREGLRLDEAMHPLTLLAVGTVRTGAAEPERRAAAARRPLEVRLQERQIDCEDSVSWRTEPSDQLDEDRSLSSTGSIRTSTHNRLDRMYRDSVNRTAAGRVFHAERRSCSTATPNRSRSCTPTWISARCIKVRFTTTIDAELRSAI